MAKSLQGKGVLGVEWRFATFNGRAGITTLVS
jgi:hypothetical protein